MWAQILRSYVVERQPLVVATNRTKLRNLHHRAASNLRVHDTDHVHVSSCPPPSAQCTPTSPILHIDGLPEIQFTRASTKTSTKQALTYVLHHDHRYSSVLFQFEWRLMFIDGPDACGPTLPLVSFPWRIVRYEFEIVICTCRTRSTCSRTCDSWGTWLSRYGGNRTTG